MAIETKFSGYIRRYTNDDLERQHRFEVSKTTTEYGTNKIVIATGSSDISIMPPGLKSAKSLFLETDNKVNVTLYGSMTSSLDVLADGFLILTGSVTDVKLSNRSATNDCSIWFDLSE
jgi:hypothetical protein